METKFEEKETALLHRQRELQTQVRQKEDELLRKYQALEDALAAKAQAQWESHLKTLEENLQHQRQQMDAEHQVLTDQFQIRTRDLDAQYQQKEREWKKQIKDTQDTAAQDWAERERELTAEHQHLLEETRNKLLEQMEFERRNLRNLHNKREEEMTQAFMSKEVDLRRTYQAEQGQWLALQEAALKTCAKN